jgi:hypothetical protein
MPRMKMTQMTAKRETTGMRRELFSSLPSLPSDPAEENRRNNNEGLLSIGVFSSFGGDLTEGNRWNNEGESTVVPYLFFPTHSKSGSLMGK